MARSDVLYARLGAVGEKHPSRVLFSLDLLSPPVLFGVSYALMFAFGAIDIAVNRSIRSYRLRDEFYHFYGLSPVALTFVWCGFLLFVVGYVSPFGSYLARAIRAALVFARGVRRRVFVRNARLHLSLFVLFGLTFPVIVLAIRQFGAGRVARQREFAAGLSYHFVAGEVSYIVYVIAVWRMMIAKRDRAARVSRLFRLFAWFMFALQVALCVWLASRTRLITVVVAAVLARHYGFKRLTGRQVIAGGLLFLLLVMPLIVLQRERHEAYQVSDLMSAARFVWDSLMRHYSALEGFTVTFEYTRTAPDPDPLWTMFASGLVPRVLWPSKPISTWAERFSLWVTGVPSSAFFPSLPGELLLHFGYFGSLMAMMILGVFWKAAYTFFGLSEKTPPAIGFVYIVMVAQAFSQLEVGFVVPYGALIRETVIGLMLFAMISTSSPLSRHHRLWRGSGARSPRALRLPQRKSATV